MKDWFCQWVVACLPVRVLYWACVRVSAHATVGAEGRYGGIEVPALSCLTALERLRRDFGL